MFSSKARPTWIFVEPLTPNAILSLTSKTLHRTKEDCADLAQFVHRASSGNAFSARSILTTLQRQKHASTLSFLSIALLTGLTD
jgi:predicted ATPase